MTILKQTVASATVQELQNTSARKRTKLFTTYVKKGQLDNLKSALQARSQIGIDVNTELMPAMQTALKAHDTKAVSAILDAQLDANKIPTKSVLNCLKDQEPLAKTRLTIFENLCDAGLKIVDRSNEIVVPLMKEVAGPKGYPPVTPIFQLLGTMFDHGLKPSDIKDASQANRQSARAFKTVELSFDVRRQEMQMAYRDTSMKSPSRPMTAREELQSNFKKAQNAPASAQNKASLKLPLSQLKR